MPELGSILVWIGRLQLLEGAFRFGLLEIAIAQEHLGKSAVRNGPHHDFKLLRCFMHERKLPTTRQQRLVGPLHSKVAATSCGARVGWSRAWRSVLFRVMASALG